LNTGSGWLSAGFEPIQTARHNRNNRAHGHLDVLVANAGILGQMQAPEAVDEENWRNVFAVNVVRGALLG